MRKMWPIFQMKTLDPTFDFSHFDYSLFILFRFLAMTTEKARNAHYSALQRTIQVR